MGIRRFTLSVVVAVLLHGSALAQDDERREFLAAAELAYPSSEVPALFSDGSASSLYAGDIEDRNWSSDMEARILLEVEKAREQGLIVRRTDVECRFRACALLLVHAKPTNAVGELMNSLRDTLGFTGISAAEKSVPMLEDGRTEFYFGYAEIVLVRDLRAAAP